MSSSRQCGATRRRLRTLFGSSLLESAEFWELLLGAAALMLVLEGMLPFFNPASWRAVFERAIKMSDGQIRTIGLASMLAGLLLLVLFWRR